MSTFPVTSVTLIAKVKNLALEGRDIGEVASKYRISRNYVSQIRVRIDKRIVDFGKTLVAGA